jgi:hypothetical protein
LAVSSLYPAVSCAGRKSVFEFAQDPTHRDRLGNLGMI